MEPRGLAVETQSCRDELSGACLHSIEVQMHCMSGVSFYSLLLGIIDPANPNVCELISRNSLTSCGCRFMVG